MNYKDGTYKYTGSGEFELYTRESAGYWVSSTNNELAKDGDLLELMRSVVEEHGAKYVGIWTEDDGTRYVDKSHYVADREVAEAAGRHWNQEAIWDILRAKAIYLT